MTHALEYLSKCKARPGKPEPKAFIKASRGDIGQLRSDLDNFHRLLREPLQGGPAYPASSALAARGLGGCDQDDDSLGCFAIHAAGDEGSDPAFFFGHNYGVRTFCITAVTRPG